MSEQQVEKAVEAQTEAKVEVKTEATSEVADTVSEEATDKAVKADKKRPARSRKAKPESKPVDLAAAGLQLVETKADVSTVTALVEEEKPRKPRKAASWQKQVNADTSAEPLVMVETQNK